MRRVGRTRYAGATALRRRRYRFITASPSRYAGAVTDDAKRSSAYGEARAEGRSALRQRLVQVASEVLERVGSEALSMRPLARAAGCSTMVFYTEFQSKDGLLEELAGAAARALLDAVGTVADTDPVSHRRLVAHAYLDAAFGAPEHYRVLFGRAPWAPGSRRRALAEGVRRDAVRALLPDAKGRERDALALWLALHGAAQLVTEGTLAPQEARDAVDTAVDASASWGNAGPN
jgi:AcrR family transcriptional regulator